MEAFEWSIGSTHYLHKSHDVGSLLELVIPNYDHSTTASELSSGQVLNKFVLSLRTCHGYAMQEELECRRRQSYLQGDLTHQLLLIQFERSRLVVTAGKGYRLTTYGYWYTILAEYMLNHC